MAYRITINVENHEDIEDALRIVAEEISEGNTSGMIGYSSDDWELERLDEDEEETREVSVAWDTDGEENPYLPERVDVPTSVIDEDNVAYWLSDHYGFCVTSYSVC